MITNIKQNSNAILFIIFFFTITIDLIAQEAITSFPYVEDFENGQAGWTSGGPNSSWELGVPTNDSISSAAFGQKAWVTSLEGNHLSNENGYVQSPIYDLTFINNPLLQLKLWWLTEENDGGTIKISVDGGTNWQVLNNTTPPGEAINWMNSVIPSLSNDSGWSGTSQRWKTVIYPLENFTNESNVVFRIEFASSGITQNEGFAFDRFQISDTTCYAGEDEDYDNSEEFDNFPYLVCIDNGQIDVSLNDLLGGINRRLSSLGGNWRFVRGPYNPRGPRRIKRERRDTVDFPNTGNGLPQKYEFQYFTGDGTCQDYATINICMSPEPPAQDTLDIYTCINNSINNTKEILNAFTLEKIRDLEGFWYDVSEDPFGVEIDTSTVFPIESGVYKYEDATVNQIVANIKPIACNSEEIIVFFDNAQNTTDGTDTFYEADVMIQTANENENLKLGDGKLFFRYNSRAFGEFVNVNGNVEVTTPDGYLISQIDELNPSENVYSQIVLDNANGVQLPNTSFGEIYTPSETNIFRFSWGFKQERNFSSPNVNNTPVKLCHIKLKYVDANEDPLLLFETEGIYDDKFTTACDSSSGDMGNCDIEARTLLINDTILSVDELETIDKISVFPNPVSNTLQINADNMSLQNIEIYSVSGRLISEYAGNNTEIDMSYLQTGIYFLKIYSGSRIKTLKIIKD